MAHLIESMVWSGETPWHGLGTQVDGLLTASEVLDAAGLNWEVGLRPAYAKLEDGTFVPISGYNATVRKTDNRAFAPVGRKYAVVNNKPALDFIDALTGAGEVKYETAGSLKGGRVCWVLAKIPNGNGDIDPLHKYLLITWTHDGSGPVRVIPTNVRVVCWNTLNLALRGIVNQFTIRHRGNIESKIEVAKAVLADSLAYFDKAALLFGRLKNESFHDWKIEKVAAKVFNFQPTNVATTEEEGRKVKKDRELLEGIIHLAHNGRGTDIAGVRGTAWGAWNAFTEYADHYAPVRVHKGTEPEEKRLESAWFGTGAEVKRASLEEIIKLTGKDLLAA